MKNNEQTDQVLVKKVQQGDKRAFDVLVLKYQHKIMGLISRYVFDRAEVEDVAQEAFIKAYRALPNFRGESAFYTWLYTIAINTAKNHLVTKGRRPPSRDIDVDDAAFFDGDSGLKDAQSPERLIARDQLKEVIFSAFEALPEDLRTAISLRELDGMSYEEIAQIMGCPIGTVRSRIFRARETIDKKMMPLMEQTA